MFFTLISDCFAAQKLNDFTRAGRKRDETIQAPFIDQRAKCLHMEEENAQCTFGSRPIGGGIVCWSSQLDAGQRDHGPAESQHTVSGSCLWPWF
jgi:hypothetical protein